jgi:hypothetical protein
MDFSDVGNERGYHILDVESGDLEFFANPVSPKFVKILLSKNEYPSDDLIKGNIVKLVIDKDIKDDTLEKIKANILALSPHQLTTEFNVTSKSIDSVEQVDSIDLTEMFEEFQKQLKLDGGKDVRVKNLIGLLYERNK